ncbi:cytochrome P450 [Mycena galopus ATCC 62051]|nr:cytochrome P450 [Mycena galopus ATCC 62051]
MPKDHEWKTFARWAKTYGDCVYVDILGQPIIILDSLSAAHELLNQRSALYSSRPRLVMGGELTGFANSLALMPYSPRFLTFRRLVHKGLTGKTLQEYWPLHEEESRLLIEKVLLNPDGLLDCIRHYAGSVILRVTYGYRSAAQDDKFLVFAERVMSVFSMASQPGAWAVDILPWLRHVPSWFPGMKFKQTAAIWYQMNMKSVEGPFEWALSNQDSPALAQPNLISTILSSEPLDKSNRETLLWASASLFGGRSDMTVAALSTFFLAMALYPEVQSTAQAEIDRVVPKGKLPQLSDRPFLPYVECLMREVLRWNPIGPLALPHLLIKNDVYKDYHLPSGSIVLANVWSMLRDSTVFPDPQEFKPERFMNDKRALDFNFTVRVCPGAQFAQSSMFIAIATALSQCDVSEARDSVGGKIERDVEYQTGTIR